MLTIWTEFGWFFCALVIPCRLITYQALQWWVGSRRPVPTTVFPMRPHGEEGGKMLVGCSELPDCDGKLRCVKRIGVLRDLVPCLNVSVSRVCDGQDYDRFGLA